MAPHLEMPTPAVVQSLIQTPRSSAVKMPARNAERKLTRWFGINFKSTANAKAEKIKVKKNPNRRDLSANIAIRRATGKLSNAEPVSEII